jgi:hypothetical protein
MKMGVLTPTWSCVDSMAHGLSQSKMRNQLLLRFAFISVIILAVHAAPAQSTNLVESSSSGSADATETCKVFEDKQGSIVRVYREPKWENRESGVGLLFADTKDPGLYWVSFNTLSEKQAKTFAEDILTTERFAEGKEIQYVNLEGSPYITCHRECDTRVVVVARTYGDRPIRFEMGQDLAKQVAQYLNRLAQRN